MSFMLIIVILVFSVPLFRDSVLNTHAEILKIVAYMVFVIDGGQVTAVILSFTILKHHEKLNRKRNVQVENPGQQDNNPGQKDKNPEPEDENTALLKKH